MNLFKKTVCKLKQTAKKIAVMASLTLTAIMMSPVSAYAVSTESATWTGGSNIDSIIGAVLGMILAIAQGVGIVLLVFGIFRIILASKDGNSNEQAQGIQLAIVGALLVALRAVLTGIGLIG